MADILIRMEMPENCAECPFISPWDDCEINHEWKFADEFDKTKDRLPSCPLLPLPEGHGRLIDAEAIITNIGEVPYKGSVRRVLMSATTIIEADLEWKMKNCCCFSNTDQAEGGTDNG